MGVIEPAKFNHIVSPVLAYYSDEQVINAMKAFRENRDNLKSDRDKSFSRLDTLVSEIAEWVRLGAMPLMDEFHMPTERGLRGIYA